MARSCQSYLCALALAFFIPTFASTAQNPDAIVQPAAPAIQDEASPAVPGISHCQAIATNDPQLEPLVQLCGFALQYRASLPDFICEQTTKSSGLQTTAVLKSEVSFESGREHYSNITIDGKTLNDSRSALGALRVVSAGEFGSDLLALFKPPIVAQFRFLKETNLRKLPVSIYTFRVAGEKNNFWSLRDDRGQRVYPAYEGELWLNRRSGEILRLLLHATNLPETMRLNKTDVTIDYSEVGIEGLGKFLLPTKSETKACYMHNTFFNCTTNVLQFHDCRKFATKSRIISQQP